MEPIRYFNRHRGRLETEAVYGERWLRWTYHHPLGRAALHTLVKRPFFSRLYGRRMSAPSSRKLVAPFIRDFEVDPAEFADDAGSFRSFNDFFIRKLKPEARPLADAPVVFPCDGRHLGFADLSAVDAVFVKGQRFDLEALLASGELAARYREGALVLSRLCPTDYHRFHFPADGTPSAPRHVNGLLYSVSPHALRTSLSYLWENKRVLTELRTADLGTIVMLDIGATNVGTIRQTFTPGRPVAKGAEKGYFAFGGSCIATLFEPGAVTLAADLLEYSAQQIELFAQMGSAMGS
ncbi:MAG: phosphatidylserine decarboxylase [Akkermansiaceae bacterium]|nr:phosphatidylserine decarboxylase [Akkermansiaceae bacterium]NNM29606.1 phosphatidylserine decarboxylase [Akkermansiaceae bacterium]